MRVGEYGNTFFLSVGLDVSGADLLQLQMVQPDAVVKTFTAALGTTNLQTPLGQFDANKWISYVFLENDVTQSGLHLFRAIATFNAPPKKLISPDVQETIDP